jgi:Ca2+-binding EF-hand superfamily protein
MEEARKMFMQFDKDGSGQIDEEELEQMIISTYRSLGIEFSPSKEDVRDYMDQYDQDGDRKISL